MRIYTPTATAKAEHDIGWYFRQRYPEVQPDKVTRFAVVLTFYSARRRGGDCDNRSKTIMDALQGLVYANDEQVDELHAMVVHVGSDPHTDIAIYRKTPEWR